LQPWLGLDAGSPMVGLLLCFGPIVYVAPLGTTPALLIALLAAALLAQRTGELALSSASRMLGIFAPLFVWMLLSSAWALDAPAALSLAARLAGLFVAGTLLVFWFTVIPLARLRPAIVALASGLAIAGLIVAVDLHYGGAFGRYLHRARPENFDPANFYGRGATIHAILIVPLFIGLWRVGAPRIGIVQAVCGIVGILATSNLSAKIALSAAVLAAVIVVLLPRLRWMILVLLGFAAAVLPFTLPATPSPSVECWLADHKPSALHRIYIWDFAAERVHERPVAGWGLDAARRIPGGDAQIVVRRCHEISQSDRPVIDSQIMPLHPHDAIMQIWLELGGIGAALGFGALILLLARAFGAAAWRNRFAQAGFAGSTLAGISVALVSFGIWQEWFLSALFFAAAIAVFAARARPSEKTSVAP
jgi:exopolysaccharide production protein ExoQ